MPNTSIIRIVYTIRPEIIPSRRSGGGVKLEVLTVNEAYSLSRWYQGGWESCKGTTTSLASLSPDDRLPGLALTLKSGHVNFGKVKIILILYKGGVGGLGFWFMSLRFGRDVLIRGAHSNLL